MPSGATPGEAPSHAAYGRERGHDARGSVAEIPIRRILVVAPLAARLGWCGVVGSIEGPYAAA
ncbi:MAG TPA: hypothetical protein VHR41_20505 [Gemmatimonadales bacterium]|jgi:hypothetical protein|nr:hypothetical protein [Gemmatimonadales bacterium]